jgi:hypothetical protein
MPGLIALSTSGNRLDGKRPTLLPANGTFGPDATVPPQNQLPVLRLLGHLGPGIFRVRQGLEPTAAVAGSNPAVLAG